MSLSEKEKSAIRKDERIEKCGLYFYPIEMSDYEMFLFCKDAITLRMGTLPVKYLAMDFMTALLNFEIDSIRQKGENAGLFDRVMRFLHLSLRIGYDAKTAADELVLAKEGDGVKIDKIALMQNGVKRDISPLAFSSKIRPLIAAQNGLELPNENDNIELVRAAEMKKELGESGVKLKSSADDLIASVAFQSRVREKDVLLWTVREFEARRRAIERDKRFMLCGVANMSGMVSFENGNPAPSWCLDALDDELGTMTLSELQDKMKGGVEGKS